jgi:ferric-dicitrate binding protein FerR (iron transport regulator)
VSPSTLRGRLELANGGLLVIDDARDVVLRVSNGSVWITEEGQSRDVILSEGQQTRLSRRGRTLVSAFGRSAVEIASPGDRAPASASLHPA